MNNFRFRVYNLAEEARFGSFTQRWMSQPGWVWRTAMLAGLVLVVLPLAILVMAVGMAFAVTVGLVFAMLAAANRLGQWVGGIGRGLRGSDEAGRRNVRVIHREDEPPIY